MKIELWSDFGCPFCYIGKKRFEKALNKFAHKDTVEVIYKAYQLDPNAPKVMVGAPNVNFAKGHNTTPAAATEKFKMFVEQAKTVGLKYDYENIKLTNTFDAHRVAKWANTLGLEAKLTDRFMSAYFQEGLNLADSNVLVKLGLEVGLDEKGLKDVVGSNQFADLVREQIQEGRQVGVQGVPFFVLNNKYGVSGAQAEEYFSQVLDQLWKESQQFESIPGSDSGQACTEEGC